MKNDVEPDYVKVLEELALLVSKLQSRIDELEESNFNRFQNVNYKISELQNNLNE